ncbi:arginine--tRNA ligase, partial [Escherichia coli]|nr:arginine--tRNA ligase [Escherichia coli]
SASVKQAIVGRILAERERYGRSDSGAGKKVQIEFVSANPTGPLHVGHGRGAAYGSALSNLLEAAGYAVTREFYVNDAGRQMDILAVSV